MTSFWRSKIIDDFKVLRDSLETLLVVGRYTPRAFVSLPVPHTIGVLALASFFHGRAPLHFVAAFQHSVTVTAETHSNLAHAVLAIKTPDSRALLSCDLRPLRPPFTTASSQPSVQYLSSQEVHRAVTEWNVAR